jgi:murein DD-endopeptidase MepM/ murein hydrolase activator NlpD
MQHYYTYLLITNAFTYGVGLIYHTLKRELTRLKLRRRGSFVDATWLSLALKPIWEKEGLKVLLGAPLAAAMVVGGSNQMLDQSRDAAINWNVTQPITNILTVDVLPPDGVVRTTYQLPVTHLHGISQPFRPGHPAIDMTGPLQSPIVSMAAGTVIDVATERFGYGNNVVVSHDYGLVTRYAHLHTIAVMPGQALQAGQVVGTLGSTGWSTGPHLHFEVYEKEEAVNPVIYLYKALELYQENLKVANERAGLRN